MVDVSVIVPCFNAGSYIDRCLAALAAQDYPRDRYEVIVVDNNSRDDTLARAQKHSGAIVLTEPKQGSYAARNRGVSQSIGRVLAFTDSDCVPEANWVATIADALDPERPELVLGRVRYGRDTLLLSILEAYEREKTAFMSSSEAPELYFGFTNNMGVTRAAMDAVGPFREMQRGADTLFVRDVVDRFSCAAVQHRPDMVVQHLEITRPWHWYRKMVIYGASQARYGQVAGARGLTSAERLSVCRETSRAGRYSPVKTGLMYGLLAFEGPFFRLGRLLGRFRKA